MIRGPALVATTHCKSACTRVHGCHKETAGPKLLPQQASGTHQRLAVHQGAGLQGLGGYHQVVDDPCGQQLVVEH